MLDPYTFGNSKCATDLVSKLNNLNEPKVTRKVLSFINENFTLLKRLEEIPNLETRLTVLNMYRTCYKAKSQFVPTTNTKFIVPKVISDHARNVVITRYRNVLENCNAEIKVEAELKKHYEEEPNRIRMQAIEAMNLYEE